jgi:hypothetical protein
MLPKNGGEMCNSNLTLSFLKCKKYSHGPCKKKSNIAYACKSRVIEDIQTLLVIGFWYTHFNIQDYLFH